ncbi:helix-turn-helix domain-containing protein [Xanthobacter sediminis]
MSDLIKPEDLPRWVPGELTLDSDPLGWDGVRIREYRYSGLDVPVPAMQDYMIVIYKDGVTPMSRRCDASWREERVMPGSVSLLTHAANSHWRWTEDIEVCHLYLSPAAVAEVAAEAYERHIRAVELFDVLRTDDPVIAGVAEMLAREARAGGLGGRLYTESLRNQACIHLLRHYADVSFREPSSYGGLSRAQCRLLVQFIEEHLDRNISLADLAGIAGLSIFHFTRKFRAEFGCPPHAYVMRRRIEHAKRLLARTDIPLKVVAASSGFADQSHMTRLFRKLLDLTPAEYRKAMTD